MVRPDPITFDDLRTFVVRAEGVVACLRRPPDDWRDVLDRLDELHPTMFKIANAEHDGVFTDRYREFQVAFRAHRELVDARLEVAVLDGSVPTTVRHQLIASVDDIACRARALQDDLSFGTVVPIG